MQLELSLGMDNPGRFEWNKLLVPTELMLVCLDTYEIGLIGTFVNTAGKEFLFYEDTYYDAAVCFEPNTYIRRDN